MSHLKDYLYRLASTRIPIKLGEKAYTIWQDKVICVIVGEYDTTGTRFRPIFEDEEVPYTYESIDGSKYDLVDDYCANKKAMEALLIYKQLNNAHNTKNNENQS